MTVLPEEISTIFVTGLPEDIQEREFQNMFTFCDGFDFAVLKNPPEEGWRDNLPPLVSSKTQLVGFAHFYSKEYALQACERITGRRAETNGKKHLTAGLVSKNINFEKEERNETSDASETLSFSPFEFDEAMYRRPSFPDLALWTQESKLPSPVLQPPPFDPLPDPEDISNYTFPDMSSSPVLAEAISPPLPPSPVNMPAKNTTIQLSSGILDQFITAVENAPCNTLYVGNLPPNATETELRDVFIKCHGYRRLSFRVKDNGPMCFVEFQDILCSTAAMHQLQGTMLRCSKKGGIRLSYSKNPLGVRSSVPNPTHIRKEVRV
ncbi:hypothetical protein ROZALSC1DRAFT_27224 [Rozella allomycis CSF55]|uniref:RRM domain-containing protein n=1 Tax=Rozella allomycis (strain CSF55) TaxID=988480 RepID=A0A4P9YNR7_ROZAC|nr:hypothetical protein ROZALSC1DRAFT_27224 [Rozella allomycis CSF55]